MNYYTTASAAAAASASKSSLSAKKALLLMLLLLLLLSVRLRGILLRRDERLRLLPRGLREAVLPSARRRVW